MNCIRPFSELGRNDAPSAGGKGASLGEMTQAGIPVPPGFVIVADAFEQFLRETDLNVEINAILQTVNKEEIHTVEHASANIQGLILEAVMPSDIKKDIEEQFATLDTSYVAVRSSATAEDGAEHAWAGQLDSFLNTTKDSLLSNVQRCWASLFTPRAIFYRFEKGLDSTKISVAVVVQKMVNSEVSGIAFSVHPVTEDHNQLIIEAGFGLGEAIVSGQVTPDSYVVTKEPRNILDINIATQTQALYRVDGGGSEWRVIPEPKASAQVLTKKQILELSELIIEIERHYGFPCDIEWAYEGGKFHIVQSRPITTLSKNSQSRKILLSKYMSREHSLFYAHVWNEANRDYFDEHVEGTNIRSMLFLLNKIGVLEVYYDLKELGRIFDTIVAEIMKQPEILDKVIADFYLYWEKLLPYVLNKKRIQMADELKDYYHNWMRWWSPMAYVFVIPDREQMSEELRNKALKVREETQEYSDDGDRIFMNYIEDFYPQYRSIAHLFIPEETYRLEALSNTEIEQIKKREGGCVVVTLDGKSKLVSLADLDTELRNNNAVIEKVDLQSTGEIRGMAASSGVVKGKVKLVLTKSALEEIQEGDVMVTYATSPDYVPTMKKCTAIVTDEGGVVCHAAIVSRELGIPCIVGTKNATDILKDGDLVEVDADNGVVRVLHVENPFGGLHQWQRLFRVQGLRFLIDDIWMEHYKTLSALTVVINDEYTSYLPHNIVERTTMEGAELVSNAEQFERYETEFRTYMREVQTYSSSLDFSSASKGEVADLLSHIARLFHFYSKTEFFSTDGAYKLFEVTKDTGIEKRLEQMGQIKNDGRSFLNSIFFGSDAVLPKLLKAFEQRFGVSERNLQQYSREEILGLFDGKSVANDEIGRRNEAFYIWSQDGKLIIKTGADAKKDIQAFVGEAIREHSETIAGTSAHTGQVRGPARIIRAGYDNFDVLHHVMDAMQKGDILVAETTSPELMPACQKAGGIITDQGGMLSHAAIVSRELNIPCVVGTSNATEVIKNGDIVEVDGNEGVVRIIERAQRG